ncbi:hypothetical protein OG921_03745 [Aldersonia sp. NBC_00410]|uniref:hypothetical protein n=1 Tax=Aldersonia sp. NBC_00410 TaxID=2975954 RepID=UPI0022595600|nr:hypothetical protein [Aldersonia sp. NBC_00410]MCX5042303.1 hypothetical protein [Aldersonia sp. NBC_00410]
MARARDPQIMADAAMALISDTPARRIQTLLDVEILAEAGVTDLSRYGAPEGIEYDIFVDAH